LNIVVSGKFLAGLLLSAAVLIGNSLISYRAVDSLLQTSGSVDTDLRALSRLKMIGANLEALESSQRGYILSGEGKHLRKCQDLLNESQGTLHELRGYIDSTPKVRRRSICLRN
jgi:CHASE3 domain sensor protein